MADGRTWRSSLCIFESAFLPEGVKVESPQVLAIDKHSATLRVEESVQQTKESAFSTTRFADERHATASRDSQRKVSQNDARGFRGRKGAAFTRCRRLRVGERNISELEGTRLVQEGLRVGGVFDGRLQSHELLQTLEIYRVQT